MTTTSTSPCAIGGNSPATNVSEVSINQEKQDVQNPSRYADGALRAWCTVAGAFCLQLYAIGVITSFGVFQDFYTTTWLTKFSASDISWIGGIQYFFELGCAPVAGKLFDKGYVRSAVLFGSMLSCFSFFMLSIVKPNQYYQVFLPQGVAMGIGALIYLPLMTLVSQHFKARKALPMGIVAAAAPVGAIVFTIMLNHLFYKLGFTQGIRAAAYMTLGLFVLGNALLFVPRTKSISPASTQSDLPIRPARLVWDMPYVLTLTSAFLLSLGSNTPGFYLQLFAEVHGVDKTVVFYCLAIMNVSSFVGRLLPNHLADRVGAINVYIPCLVLTGLVELAMLGCINVVGLILFSIFYGFLFGSVIALYLPMISELTPPGVEMGKRMGVALIPIGVASMVGPPITGAILGPDYVWWKAIVFSSIIILAASACNITARQVHRRGASGQLPPRCESPLDTPHALDSVSTDLEKSCHH